MQDLGIGWAGCPDAADFINDAKTAGSKRLVFFMMMKPLLEIAAAYITAAWLIDGSSDRCI